MFIWANSLREPKYEKLDRVFMDTDWKFKFLLVSVRALERIEDLLDQTPILLTNSLPRPQCTRRFKFELGWLHREGFQKMVKKIWKRPIAGATLIQR